MPSNTTTAIASQHLAHFSQILSAREKSLVVTMSSASTPLRLLRQQLQSHEVVTKRGYSNARPRCPLPTVRAKIPIRRPYTTYSTPTEKIRAAILKARLQYPILVPFLFLTSIGSLSVLGLLAYDQYTRADPLPSEWPAPVEQQLRLALNFVHKQPNPNRAAEFFGRALEAANQCGMDPFSKEVLGIRIRLAEMFEHFHKVKASIEVTDGIVKDCEERLTQLSRETVQRALEVGKEQPQEQQTAILRTIIGIKVHTAQLYMSEYLQDPSSAKKTLSDAIGLLLRHTQDPQTSGFNEHNAAGLSLDEIAAILNDMSDIYNSTREFANAIQVATLTLGVIRKACSGRASCKEAQVMSNIAAIMGSAAYEPNTIINGQPATLENVKNVREAALRWAEQAIVTAQKVPLEERADNVCETALLGSITAKAGLLQSLGRVMESKETMASIPQLVPQLDLNSTEQMRLDRIKETVEQGGTPERQGKEVF